MQIVLKDINEAPFHILKSCIGQAACDFLKSEEERTIFVALNADVVHVYQTKTTEDIFEWLPRSSNEMTQSHEQTQQEFVIKLTNEQKNTTPLIVILPSDNPTFKLVLSARSHAELFIIENSGKAQISRQHIIIEQYANLKYSLLCCDSASSLDPAVKPRDDIAISLERIVEIKAHGVFYDQHVFCTQSQINVNSRIKLEEDFAKSVSVGCLFTEAGQFHYEPVQEHFAQHTKSSLNFKVVLAKHAKSIFRGLVVLHKSAQKSEARQENKNLLLSRTARADSEPRLEIEPNDVLCKHGSATAEIDKQQLYYLMSRGFSKQDTKTLIVKSFCHAPFVDLENECGFLSMLTTLALDYTFDTHMSALNS